MASGMSDIWSESTRLLSLVSGTLLIPLAYALALDNLVAALVTGPVENGTILLPSFVGSLCTGDFPIFHLISTLESLEWSSITMTSSLLIEESNMDLGLSMYLLVTLVEFLLGS
jgi:hypothetical protein